MQEPSEDGGNDLPGHAELVCEPAAWPFLPSFGEPLPQLVDLRLGLTIHEKRYALREPERRAAVERHEFLSGEPECRRHERSLGAGPRVPVTRGVQDLRILEDRGVEVDRFFGLIVERQERGDLLHVGILLTMSVATHALEPVATTRRDERRLP